MPQFRSKGKGKNRTVYPVDPRKRYVHGRVYHVKKVYHTKDKRPVAGYFTDIKGEVHPIQGESKAEVESFRKVEEAKTINTPNTKVISGVKMNEPKTYPNGITFEEAEEYKQALVSGKAIYATGNTTQLDNKIVFSNNTLNVYTKEDDGWKFTRQFASDATAKNLFGVMVKTEKRPFTIKEKQNDPNKNR